MYTYYFLFLIGIWIGHSIISRHCFINTYYFSMTAKFKFIDRHTKTTNSDKKKRCKSLSKAETQMRCKVTDNVNDDVRKPRALVTSSKAKL